MPELKTKATKISVEDFIATCDPKKQGDSLKIVELMEKITGEPAVMWGPSIIGFGKYHYETKSGCKGDICRVGFSPRKAAYSFYVGCETGENADLLSKLGKHKLGAGGCLYVNKISDIDIKVLAKLIKEGFKMTENSKV